MKAKLEYVKSLRWADYLFFALLEPRRLTGRIADPASKPLAGGIAIALAAAFFDVLAASLLVVNTPFFYYKLTYGFLLLFIILAVRILATAGLIDILCQFLGHQGAARSIISLVFYSLFPQLFLLPLVYIFKVFGFAPPFFYALFSIGLFAWSALIVVTGLSEVHSIPFTKAALIFLFPYAFAAVTGFLASVLAVLYVFGYFAAM
ncbi:MAG: hypothetical protein KBA61_01285 [Spirochaetes bacterium]|nr:hypothetical protein [Spirochaetota bacterium]